MSYKRGEEWYLSGTRVKIVKEPRAVDRSITVKYLEDRSNESGTITAKKGEKTTVYISALSKNYC